MEAQTINELHLEAFAEIEDNPRLPRVLIIGDSISIGYTLPVRDFLKGKANIHRPPTNSHSTRVGLKHLDDWLGKKSWDIIHFNFGLHDLRYHKPPAGIINVPLDEYKKHLNSIVQRLQKTEAVIIWANTTPVQNKLVQPIGARLNTDVVRYNKTAGEIMKKNGIKTTNLYEIALTASLPEIQLPDGVHFNEKGYKIMARKVVENLLDVLRL